ncbi:MAG: hypothetical protein V4717_24040 [Bacteroidota bacterium]
MAQNVAINNSGAAAEKSAMLDISSTTKGILIPRMKTSERTAIQNLVEGLLVFDTDTKSFWFYNAAWKQILNSGSVVLPTGAASGDLYGSYPSPNVGKIQNLDVLAGVPFDKQVMKWDQLNNRWQGLNDSLFLPYNVSFSSSTKLFGITNNSIEAGSVAVYGKSGAAGSGLTPANTSGVWGDNSSGAGVIGTANTGQGVFGFSFKNNGVQGYSTLAGTAGVYGAHANANGIGVMGELQNKGIAIFGKITGPLGLAGSFVSGDVTHSDTTFKTETMGVGMLASFNVKNPGNTASALNVFQSGKGDGVHVYVNNGTNTKAAITGYHSGVGVGISGTSENGIAGKFVNNNLNNNNEALYVATYGSQPAARFVIESNYNPNALLLGQHQGVGNGITLFLSNLANTGNGLDISQNGIGKGAQISLSNPANVKEALYVNTEGKGAAAFFNGNNYQGDASTVKVKNNGLGRGIEAINTSTSTTAPAVYASSGGTNGLQAYARETAVLGQATGLSHGIGVFGQSSLNDIHGIGVKGVSYGNAMYQGAVTGINEADGTGVYGSSAATGNYGIGVHGKAEGVDGTGVRGDNNSQINPAVFGRNGGGGKGVYGYSFGNTPVGVQGKAAPANGTRGVGVLGESDDFGDGVKGTGGNEGNGIFGVAGESGNGIYATSLFGSNSGRAGLFETLAATNTYDCVKMNNAGLGGTLSINSSNNVNAITVFRVTKSGTGDYAVFENGTGVNLIRFNNLGKGFFNGGTQVGGADMAEAFDVTESVTSYEAGDVLIIAVNSDRTVEKSSLPYSSLVAGVYATKPGMLMTEEAIDADLSSKVPMGVVGVIPTKVCLEGGIIRRGDFLVTSSKAGIAMKGDPGKIKIGQVIGKALENYNAEEVLKIRVLVNVK